MSKDIDITGIDKPLLLMKLFNAAKYHIAGKAADWKPDGMTLQDARLLLRKGGTDIREVDGRKLHVALGGDTMNPAFYDKANGEGAAQKIVAALRENIETSAAFRPLSSGREAVRTRALTPGG